MLHADRGKREEKGLASTQLKQRQKQKLNLNITLNKQTIKFQITIIKVSVYGPCTLVLS